MTISFGSGSKYAEISLQRMFGQPGLGYFRLFFDFLALIREQPEQARVALVDFCGDITVRGADAQTWSVARLHPADPPLTIESYEGSNTRSLRMEAELDGQRIEAIERIRSGGDLHWTVNLRAQAIQQGQTFTVGGGQDMPMVKGQWVEVLNQVGYRRTLLLEIPLSGTKNRNMAKAVKHLDAAQEALMSGDSRAAIGLCRDALESLSYAVGGDERNISFEGSSSFTKEQRLLVLRKALRLLPHAAKHSEPAEQSVEWERKDAEMLIAMVAAFIRRYLAP